MDREGFYTFLSVFYEVPAPACKFSISLYIYTFFALFETPAADATCLCTFMTGTIDLH